MKAKEKGLQREDAGAPELSAAFEGGGSNNGLRSGQEGGGGTFPLLWSPRRGLWEEEEKRAASVTRPICQSNHDHASRDIANQPCILCKSAAEPCSRRRQIGITRKKEAPLEGRAGLSTRSKLLARREHQTRPKGGGKARNVWRVGRVNRRVVQPRFGHASHAICA